MDKKRILLVEDDKKLLAVNKMLLETRGFAVETALTLAETWEALSKRTPTAIILDRGMPDGDGLDFLGEFRKTSRIPVLMLTGYKEDEDMVQGYDSGCDDYLTKPFSFAVLLRKLQSLLRRAEEVPDAIVKGGLSLKLTPREASVNGVDLKLRPKEYALLQYLVQNEGRVMSGEDVYQAVWGQPMSGDSTSFRVTVSRLRNKLVGCGYTISNERENGYCFERGDAV